MFVFLVYLVSFRLLNCFVGLRQNAGCQLSHGHVHVDAGAEGQPEALKVHRHLLGAAQRDPTPSNQAYSITTYKLDVLNV